VSAARPLVSVRQALRRAEPLLGRRPLLLVSDFDGTLSPIVLDPWGARMLPSARRSLRRLAGTPGVDVALLSGRAAADVAGRVRIGGAAYLGNHGLERGYLPRRQRVSSLRVELVTVPAADAALAERVAADVARRIAEPWLVVEHKPPTVAFHFRGAPDVDAAGERVRAAVEEADPGRVLVRFPGRRVLELRPPGAPEKGDAMRLLLEEHRPAVAFVLGDDVSDALAFETLRRAREAGEVDGLAVAVQARAEAPPAVAEAADLVLGSPVDAARFLAGLARRVGAVPAGRPPVAPHPTA
jgi:trehalose-phosphatase